jgi:hypothetical protein
VRDNCNRPAIGPNAYTVASSPLMGFSNRDFSMHHCLPFNLELNSMLIIHSNGGRGQVCGAVGMSRTWIHATFLALESRERSTTAPCLNLLQPEHFSWVVAQHAIRVRMRGCYRSHRPPPERQDLSPLPLVSKCEHQPLLSPVYASFSPRSRPDSHLPFPRISSQPASPSWIVFN